jgi:hypothetical protein
VADIAKLSVGREAYYPRTVSVRPRRVPGPLVRRRRGQPGAAGRSIGAGVPVHVRGLPPRHRRAAGPPPRQGGRAGVRRGSAADQERVDPVRPGRPGDRPSRNERPPRRRPRGRRLPGPASGHPSWPRRCPARVRTGVVGGRVRPPHVPRGRSAAAHPPGGGQPGPGTGRTLDGAGRPGPVPAPAGGGRDLPGQLPAPACPDARGGVDASDSSAVLPHRSVVSSAWRCALPSRRTRGKLAT